MKVLTTLVCLLVAIAGFAQQSPSKEKNESIPNIDNMPVLRGHGSALDMPTRNGKGETISIPNRSMPAPLTPGEQVSMDLKAVGEPLKNWIADSLNRVNPNLTRPGKKN